MARTLADTSKDVSAKKAFIQAESKGKKAKPNSADMIKVTHYIRRDQVGAIDRIRAKRLESGMALGEVDKSSLLREAIDLLVKQESV